MTAPVPPFCSTPNHLTPGGNVMDYFYRKGSNTYKEMTVRLDVGDWVLLSGDSPKTYDRATKLTGGVWGQVTDVAPAQDGYGYYIGVTTDRGDGDLVSEIPAPSQGRWIVAAGDTHDEIRGHYAELCESRKAESQDPEPVHEPVSAPVVETSTDDRGTYVVAAVPLTQRQKPESLRGPDYARQLWQSRQNGKGNYSLGSQSGRMNGTAEPAPVVPAEPARNYRTVPNRAALRAHGVRGRTSTFRTLFRGGK